MDYSQDHHVVAKFRRSCPAIARMFDLGQLAGPLGAVGSSGTHSSLGFRLGACPWFQLSRGGSSAIGEGQQCRMGKLWFFVPLESKFSRLLTDRYCRTASLACPPSSHSHEKLPGLMLRERKLTIEKDPRVHTAATNEELLTISSHFVLLR
jgi:hypothetical protein